MEILAALLLGGFFAFNTLATPARVGKAAESALRKQFPGAAVHVEVRGKRGRAVLQGRFQSVRVEMSGARFGATALASQANTLGGMPPKVRVGTVGHMEVRLRDWSFGELAVKKTDVSLDDVRYDFGALKSRSQLRLLSFANGKVALALDAPALLPLFVRRAPEIVAPRIELRDGEMILSGRREFLGTSTSVVVRGPLVAHGQNLEISAARVEVGGTTLPPALAAPILRGVNPIYSFDAGKWPFALDIRSIRAQSDALEIEGALSAK